MKIHGGEYRITGARAATLRCLLFLFIVHHSSLIVPADTHYVDINSTNPVPPYTNWATASTTIQAAVDAAMSGDLVRVADGTYSSGGVIRPEEPDVINRIYVTNAIEIHAQNPGQCIIDGTPNPPATYSRCAYLASNAVLSGFSLQNGRVTENPPGGLSIYDGGGVYGPGATVTDCSFQMCSARNGGGAYGAHLDSCDLQNCYAEDDGGGLYGGTAVESTFSNNSAEGGGGGASDSALHGCTLANNWAIVGRGGGVLRCTASNTTFSMNDGHFGGGAAESSLNGCTLEFNNAGSRGGGAFYCTASNSVFRDNTASEGGGAFAGVYFNCDFFDNWGGNRGGGIAGCDPEDPHFPETCDSLAADSTFMGNQAHYGGAAHSCILSNCDVRANSALNGGGATFSCSLYGCTVADNTSNEGPLISGSGDHVISDCHVENNTPMGGTLFLSALLF